MARGKLLPLLRNRRIFVIPHVSLYRSFILCGLALFLLFFFFFFAAFFIVEPPLSLPDLTAQDEPILLWSNYTDATNDSALSDTVGRSMMQTSDSVWTSKLSKYYYGCSDPSNSFMRQVSRSQSNGYLLVEASGGLNQQRTGIVDAVVVARILNATLVVPHLDHTSFWKDSSNFSDIFDIEWFITSLQPYLSIIKELPANLPILEERILSIRVPRRCTADYYRKKVLPILRKHKVIRLTKFDYRLANRLEEDLQKLRCKVNYHALQFTKDIQAMGNMVVERLRHQSNHYIAIHLRYEPDMLAFSGCYYGGGEKEIKDLGLLRTRWKAIHHRNPDRERRNGRCPLTPEEVGFMLRALGFGSDSLVYVASGDVYGGDDTLGPLKRMFPQYNTKDILASREELHPFSGYSSRLAAIDYIVCDQSDVFVTNNNGNMARILAGRRRYFGHKPTIRPNAKKLWSRFVAKRNMTWDDFASQVQRWQKGFMGEPNEMRPGRGQFFENPSVCICQTSNRNKNWKALPDPRIHGVGKRDEKFPSSNKVEEQKTGENNVMNQQHRMEEGEGARAKEKYVDNLKKEYVVEQKPVELSDADFEDYVDGGSVDDIDTEESQWLSD